MSSNEYVFETKDLWRLTVSTYSYLRCPSGDLKFEVRDVVILVFLRNPVKNSLIVMESFSLFKFFALLSDLTS